MYEKQSQLRILAALLIVVIALAAGLFFFIPTKENADVGAQIAPTPTDTQPAQHKKLREAEISLEPNLSYTQTIGGSGDERVVETFFNDDKLYIFGNTTSNDFDFDQSGAFLAILDEYGSTLSFKSYQGELKAVTLFEGGFVMALDRSSPVAVAVDYMGDEIVATGLSTVSEEKTLDIKYTDECFLYITSLTQSATGRTRLKMTMLDFSLKYIGSLITNEVYSLEYIDTLDVMGEYRLIANALSDKNMICTGPWGKKLAHYPLDASYRAIDFWILDDFYYLAETDKGTELVKADGTSVTLDVDHKGGNIVGDDANLYINVGNSFFCTDGERITFSAQYGKTNFYVDNLIYAVSLNGDQTTVRAFSKGEKQAEASFLLPLSEANIITCPKGMFVFGCTTGKFGGSDITIAKLNDSAMQF